MPKYIFTRIALKFTVFEQTHESMKPKI